MLKVLLGICEKNPSGSNGRKLKIKESMKEGPLTRTQL